MEHANRSTNTTAKTYHTADGFLFPNYQGQTLNSTYSVVTVGGDGSGKLLIRGYFYPTNQPNTQFQLCYQVAGNALIETPVIITTNSQGNGDVAYSVGGVTRGSHTVVVEIQNADPSISGGRIT